MWQADNFVKKMMSINISNKRKKIAFGNKEHTTTPDLYNINAHTNGHENQLIFTQVIVRKCNARTDGRHTDILKNGYLCSYPE